MSMLDAQDNDQRSYMEIADALRQYGAKPEEDCAQLWRRIVFSILISNSDDHLRNHGFLYNPTGGWRLAPAYDLNPVPLDIKPRISHDRNRRSGRNRFSRFGVRCCGAFWAQARQRTKDRK
jgi:serine/threonine-protein kinase HipA